MKTVVLGSIALLLALSAVHAEEKPAVDVKTAPAWAKRFADPFARSSAYAELKSHGEAAIPLLLVLVRHEDREVVTRAASVFAALGPRAAPVLGELTALLTDDPRGPTRIAAVRVIEAMGEASLAASPALVKALTDKEAGVRWRAAWALGQLGDASRGAVPAIAGLLDDVDGQVRRWAAHSLQRIGPGARAGVRGLVALVIREDDDWIRRSAARALFAIGPEGSGGLVAALKAGGRRDYLVGALAAGKEAAIPVLVPLLSDRDEKLRAAAEDAVVEVGWIAIPELERVGATALRTRILTGGFERYVKFSDDRVLVSGTPIEADTAKLSIRWNYGSGHGFSLGLARLEWTGGGMRIDRIRYKFERGKGEPRDGLVVTERATLPAARANALLTMLRHAATLELRDKPREGVIGGRSWHTTGDFHAHLRIAQGDRILFEDSYTGYRGSGSEKQYIRVAVAGRILAEATEDLKFAARPVDEADRAALLDRMEGSAKDGWWVKGRLLIMAGTIGDERHLPQLRKAIEAPMGMVVRRHVYAIDAYAKISGVDFRPQNFGEGSVAAVRAKYLKHFQAEAK